MLHKNLVPMPKVKVTVRSEVKLCLKLCCSYTFKANLMKLHRKIKDNAVSRIKLRFLCRRSRSQSGQRSKSCFRNNSKITEANLMKLPRKIEYNEKICSAQELGSYSQGQGHNTVRDQIAPKIRSE